MDEHIPTCCVKRVIKTPENSKNVYIFTKYCCSRDRNLERQYSPAHNVHDSCVGRVVVYITGRYHSPGVDGRRRSVVRVGRPIGVAGQSKRHAKSSAVETGKTRGPTARQSVGNRRVGRQGERSRGRDDVLVPRDEDTVGPVDKTPHSQGESRCRVLPRCSAFEQRA